MGEDGGADGDELSAVLAQSAVGVGVLSVDAQGLRHQRFAGGRRVGSRLRGQGHALDGPGEIDCGGSGGRQGLSDRPQLGQEVIHVRGFDMSGPQGHPVGGGDADEGGASHPHLADGRRHLVVVLQL